MDLVKQAGVRQQYIDQGHEDKLDALARSYLKKVARNSETWCDGHCHIPPIYA